MSYRQRHYQIPKTPLGESFRELINNDDLIHDRRCMLANLKNVAHQWFNGLNILNFNPVDTNGRVRYIDEMCSRPWGMKGPERMWCEGIAIPLRPREKHIHEAVELCIAGGSGQLWSTKPTAGLRYKSAADGSWSNIRWFGTKNALWLQMRQDAQFLEITEIVDMAFVMEPGMVRESGTIKEDPERFKHGFRIEGIGTPQLRMSEFYRETADSANPRIMSPEDRIDFTMMQLTMASGFAKTSRPEASAHMASVGISALCSRCVARYGLPGDPKRINFLSAELDNPENPWLPGKTADETYLWMLDYIYNILGDCKAEQLSKPIAEAIGEPLLDAMAQAVSREPTAARSALIMNLRKEHAPTPE